jgi:hypothetical protein
VKKDIRDLANVQDIGKFNKLIEALAAQSSGTNEGTRIYRKKLLALCKQFLRSP